MGAQVSTRATAVRRVDLYTWIRKEREARGLSQSKLSLLTGIAQSKLSSWEHGKVRPNDDDEIVVRRALAKFDADRKDGSHVEYMAKTKWSQAYKEF